MCYNVNGCGIKADSNLFNELAIYYNVRNVYHLWHCDNSFEGVKGSDLITCDDIISMYEKVYLQLLMIMWSYIFILKLK